MELHTRHGLSHMIRNLKWLVTEQRMSDLLLGLPILEALCLNTRELLVAVADRFCGNKHAEKLLETMVGGHNGRTSPVMEGVRKKW